MCFSTDPSLSTATSTADVVLSPTSCTDRTVVSIAAGATTTLVRWVRSDSNRLVSESICSTSPWARAKNARTSSSELVARRAGRRRWSTKKR